MSNSHDQRRSGWWRVASLGVVIVALLALGRMPVVTQALDRVTAWIDGLGVWAPVVFGVVYAAATVLFVPGLILSLAAGALFGVVGGTAVISVSSTIGAALSFLVSRHLLRDWATRRVAGHPRFAAIDRAIGRESAKLVLLLRLSPAVPFNALNYLLGLTAVPFWTYVVWSWIGMLPGTVLYVYLGHAGRAGLAAAGGEGVDGLKLAFTLAGLAATVAVTWYVTRIARRALRELAGDEPATGSPVPPR